MAVVKQENSYYGFGLIMPNSPVTPLGTPNKKLYNGGSEWQNDFINLPDYYETPNRNYDAALGRFISVDLMAESAESLTTYNYAGNNPILSNDPTGNITQAEQQYLDWMSSDQSKPGNTAADFYDGNSIGSGTGRHDGGSGFSGNNNWGSSGSMGGSTMSGSGGVTFGVSNNGTAPGCYCGGTSAAAWVDGGTPGSSINDYNTWITIDNGELNIHTTRPTLTASQGGMTGMDS